MGNEIRVIQLILALRNCSKMNLPISESLVAFDLILFISISYLDRKPITIKELFSNLPYSYTAVRQHYNRLLINGYITHKPHENDRRVKYLEPTNKLVNSVIKYANDAKRILSTPPIIEVPPIFIRLFLVEYFERMAYVLS